MIDGTAGRNRTDTPKERDFESRASTNSATAAKIRPPFRNFFYKAQPFLIGITHIFSNRGESLGVKGNKLDNKVLTRF